MLSLSDFRLARSQSIPWRGRQPNLQPMARWIMPELEATAPPIPVCCCSCQKWLTRPFRSTFRSHNGAEMTAKVIRSWLGQLGARTLYIEPGSPWENGYCKSFNGKLRDECLNQENLYSEEIVRSPNSGRGDIWLTDGACPTDATDRSF